ncbi:hypothetical protein GSY74_02250 [Sulfurovum sp. bin170]|uniref:hypothetical protein n=1 Tax=Sulfurovum sp. bin170 TaxID=2695268 RepID=UPI0013DEEAA5|nr:hypothetical protein [Sulfurovum sp. bin170]NEW60093.1 hypothetical protein [Sulfurovum sp. bin170]
MTKILLSLVAISVVASATEAKSDTTVDGKAQLYYYTTDNKDKLFSNESANAGGAVTLNVSHKFSDAISANFTAIGYDSLGASVGGAMEGKNKGSLFDPEDNMAKRHTSDAYFGNANIVATMGGTTAIVGRQQLNTPMLGSFDWLLAPSHFEAGTVVHKIANLTLIGAYVTKLRANNSGTEFVKLADDNYAIGMAYSSVVDANLWYYNIDAGGYTQIYADVSEKRSGVLYAVQAVSTNYDEGDDSMAYGLKVAGEIDGWGMSIAYNNIQDRAAGKVEVDSLYTSSWNTWASDKLDNSFKVEASRKFSGLASTLSYAKYDDGCEVDVILGYEVAKNISLNAIFSNTEYTEDSDAEKALEFIGTYKF